MVHPTQGANNTRGEYEGEELTHLECHIQNATWDERMQSASLYDEDLVAQYLMSCHGHPPIVYGRRTLLHQLLITDPLLVIALVSSVMSLPAFTLSIPQSITQPPPLPPSPSPSAAPHSRACGRSVGSR